MNRTTTVVVALIAAASLSREQEVKRHLVMRENETFVDVGANVGSYSLMVSKAGGFPAVASV